jgi:hypothetical protein
MMKYLLNILFCLNVFTNTAFAASAVYYSQEFNATYRKTGQSDLNLAIREAKEKCEKDATDCKMAVYSYKSGYGAIARSPQGHIGVKLAAPTKKIAMKEALKICQEDGNMCKITVSFHDPISAPPPQQVEQQCANPRTGIGMICGSAYDFSGNPVWVGN